MSLKYIPIVKINFYGVEDTYYIYNVCEDLIIRYDGSSELFRYCDYKSDNLNIVSSTSGNKYEADLGLLMALKYETFQLFSAANDYILSQVRKIKRELKIRKILCR